MVEPEINPEIFYSKAYGLTCRGVLQIPQNSKADFRVNFQPLRLVVDSFLTLHLQLHLVGITLSGQSVYVFLIFYVD